VKQLPLLELEKQRGAGDSELELNDLRTWF
jgi:hypothetical protein